MQTIVQEVAYLARLATGQPESLAEQIAVGALGTVAFLVVLLVVGRVFQCAMAEPGRVVATLATLLIVAGVAAGATRLWLVPAVGDFSGSGWVMVGVTLVAVIALGVPAGCFMLKGSYGKVLVAVVLALAAAAVSMVLVRAGFRVFRAGDAGLAPAHIRHEQAGEAMGRKP